MLSCRLWCLGNNVNVRLSCVRNSLFAYVLEQTKSIQPVLDEHVAISMMKVATINSRIPSIKGITRFVKITDLSKIVNNTIGP